MSIATNAPKSLNWQQPLPGLRVVKRGDVPITRVQIYGQRCSGTNLVTRAIEANMPGVAITEAFGFKHWFVPPQTLFVKDTLVLVVARDAYDWARSLHRQPWHAHPELKAKPFDAFIRSDWHSYWDDHFGHIEPGHPMHGDEMLHERDPETGERFANCIAKRTAKLRHWSSLTNRAHNVALLGYDAFARDPAAFVTALAAVAEIERREPFVPITSYKGQGHAPYVPTAYPDLAAEDAAHIAAWLDPKVEAAFGLSADYADRYQSPSRAAPVQRSA
ncbi:MAG: hypothetical protein DI640_11870 [Sphingomonas taxi]|uniref:Sulfotransferase family protein n=1 Tax=Sphingomonas taxi TaxID=1549858 RepID=A0A2W4YSG6_9SPHN|nr:MAG: hypothetical protein DI640_11870 [Sphingomonas taxi]